MITVSGISETIQRLARVQEGRDDNSEKLKLVLEKIARLGVSVAWQHYSDVPYDGNSDFDVDWQENGDNSVCVIAKGKDILFLEFGTGAKFAQPYPNDEGFEPVFKAGDWSLSPQGKGQWNNPKGWYYTDESSGKKSIHSYGSPPARGMYEAKKEMKNNVDRIIREVFG